MWFPLVSPATWPSILPPSKNLRTSVVLVPFRWVFSVPSRSRASALCVTESEDCWQPDIQGLRMAPQSPLKCKLASEKARAG